MWYFLFKLFVKEEEVLEMGSKGNDSQSENGASSAEELYKIVMGHHEYILS